MSGEVKKLQFSEGTSVGNPTDLSLATSTNHLKSFANDAAYIADKGSAAAEGDVYIDSTYGRVRYYSNGIWKNTILAYDPSDATKTWDVVLSGATTATRTLLRFLQTVARQIDFPDATGEILLADNTKGVDNKTLTAETNVFQSSTGTARKVDISASGATNSTKTTMKFAQTADRTVTFPDATDTLMGKATTDAMTNKDFQGGTASNTSRITIPSATKATLDGLTRKQGTVVYGTDTGLLYADNGSSLIPVGASGSGEINLIANPNDTYSTWATTGSGPTGATSLSASDLPLSGVYPTCIKLTSLTSANAEASHYYGYSFTTPASLATKLKIDLWLRPGTNFIANEWTVSIYAGSTRQNLSTDASSVTYLPNNSGKFTTTFDCAASTVYTLRIARTVNAGTNAGILNLGGIVVGPGIQPQGAIASPWFAFTPTIGNVTSPTGVTGFYRRIGDSIEVAAKWSGAPSSSSAVTCSLPSGLTINTSLLPSGGSGTPDAFGVMQLNPNTGNVYFLDVIYAGSNTVKFCGYNASAYYNSTVPVAANAGDQPNIRFTVPVNEYAGSGTVNVVQNDVEYAASTTGTWDAAAAAANTIYGPAGAPISGSLSADRNKVVQFNTPIGPTDKIFLEYLVATSNGTKLWVEAPDTAYAGVAWPSVNFGARINDSAAINQVTVFFAQYAIAGTTYNSLTGAQNWSTGIATAWRLKKVTGGQSVGFGEVLPGVSAGLVSANGLKGRSVSTAIGSGYVGESGVGSGASNTSFVNNAYATGDSTTLPSTGGTFLVTAVFSQIAITANSGGRPYLGLAYNSGGYTDLIQIRPLKNDGGTITDGGSLTVSYVVNFDSTDSSAVRTVAARGQVALGSSITGTFTSQIFWQRIA